VPIGFKNTPILRQIYSFYFPQKYSFNDAFLLLIGTQEMDEL